MIWVNLVTDFSGGRWTSPILISSLA